MSKEPLPNLAPSRNNSPGTEHTSKPRNNGWFKTRMAAKTHAGKERNGGVHTAYMSMNLGNTSLTNKNMMRAGRGP